MRRMDALSLRHPFYGSRQMTRHLRREGRAVGRRRVRRLMRRMGLEALYRQPRTSRPHPDHAVYPYLLGGLTIDRPNQVWCADITYIPLAAGAGGGASDRYAGHLQHGPGAQFTSAAFTGRVLAAGARCSMDGRGRCLDNVFIERLWRSLKYEAVYLHELRDGFAAERVIAEWMRFYSHVRPHSALGGRTPAEVYGAERAA